MQKKIHISIKIADILAKSVYWFYAFVTLLIFIIMVMYVLGIGFAKFPLAIDIPIRFDVIEKGKLILGIDIKEVSIQATSGSIRFDNLPLGIAIVFMAVFLVSSSVIVFTLSLISKFTGNVKKGFLFMPENIAILRKVAYILLSLWFALKIMTGIFNYAIVEKIQFAGLKFEFTSGSFSGIFWASITIWVLSYIFVKGAEIEKENSLTI